jgi:hypothetical protein
MIDPRDCNNCSLHIQGERCRVDALCLNAPPAGVKLPLWQPLVPLLARPRPALVKA